MSELIYTQDKIDAVIGILNAVIGDLKNALICVGDDPCTEECIDTARHHLGSLDTDLWDMTMEVCPECKCEGFDPDKPDSLTEDCFRCGGIGFVYRTTLVPGYVRRCRECACTDDDCSECIAKTGEPCDWVEWDLCSACYAEIVEGAKS